MEFCTKLNTLLVIYLRSIQLWAVNIISPYSHFDLAEKSTGGTNIVLTVDFSVALLSSAPVEMTEGVGMTAGEK